jgi:toxin CptA
MSIALSAVVRPSRVHRCLLAGAGLSLFAAALAVGVFASVRFHAAWFQALSLAGAAAVLMHAGSGRAKTHRLDISGTGALVLTVQQGLREPNLPGAAAAAENAVGVTLLPGSVVWPPLMLLRLDSPGLGVRVLPVWRDSVEPGAWRALAVAVLAVGRRAAGETERLTKLSGQGASSKTVREYGETNATPP